MGKRDTAKWVRRALVSFKRIDKLKKGITINA
jgi:hypothetical protein